MAHDKCLKELSNNIRCNCIKDDINFVKNLPKYVCPIRYYHNCRAHDGGDYLTIEFFKTEQELLDYALSFIDDHEIISIRNVMGYHVADIYYDLGSHSCNGIKVVFENSIYRTKDNGKGKLIWEKI